MKINQIFNKIINESEIKNISPMALNYMLQILNSKIKFMNFITTNINKEQNKDIIKQFIDGYDLNPNQNVKSALIWKQLVALKDKIYFYDSSYSKNDNVEFIGYNEKTGQIITKLLELNSKCKKIYDSMINNNKDFQFIYNTMIKNGAMILN